MAIGIKGEKFGLMLNEKLGGAESKSAHPKLSNSALFFQVSSAINQKQS